MLTGMLLGLMYGMLHYKSCDCLFHRLLFGAWKPSSAIYQWDQQKTDDLYIFIIGVSFFGIKVIRLEVLLVVFLFFFDPFISFCKTHYFYYHFVQIYYISPWYCRWRKSLKFRYSSQDFCWCLLGKCHVWTVLLSADSVLYSISNSNCLLVTTNSLVERHTLILT